MHPVASQVEVPMDQLERILLRRAVRGFFGQMVIGIRVLPEAVQSVELDSVTNEFQQIRQGPAWRDIGTQTPPRIMPDRHDVVRKFIAENAGKIRLVTTVTKVTGHFDDGVLRKLEWELPG
jgi:hypothetical protein